MNVLCYITFKKRRNEQEQNPSLQRGSQTIKPLRYTTLLEKGYINNFINFESIFLENG